MEEIEARAENDNSENKEENEDQKEGENTDNKEGKLSIRIRIFILVMPNIVKSKTFTPVILDLPFFCWLYKEINIIILNLFSVLI